jgi:hypothetical protein
MGASTINIFLTSFKERAKSTTMKKFDFRITQPATTHFIGKITVEAENKREAKKLIRRMSQKELENIADMFHTSDECDANGTIEVWDNGFEITSPSPRPSEAEISHAKETLKKAGYFMISWTTQDVIGRAEELKKKLSQKQLAEVVDSIERLHDATIGVNWDVIDEAIISIKIK